MSLWAPPNGDRVASGAPEAQNGEPGGPPLASSMAAAMPKASLAARTARAV
jgi:hypothetical protein